MKSIVMLGATGAVGGQALTRLLRFGQCEQLTLLGRRPVEGLQFDFLRQHRVDIFNPASYHGLLEGHDTAVCTLGVGQPSKASRAEFTKVDKVAVLDFARECFNAGVRRFVLLSSVGADASSRSFFLRTKGELIEELEKLGFESLSVFQPSMIITPTNRYGFSQALTLMFWPILSHAFLGPLQRFRGINVDQLGVAIARQALDAEDGFYRLFWPDFIRLSHLTFDTGGLKSCMPILYVKTGCPWCEEVITYLNQEKIAYETVIVSGNAEAMQEMIDLSGQSKAPTMDFYGEVLADFGVDELKPFLAEHQGLIKD